MISSDDNKDATNADESSACNTNYTSHFSLLTSHFIKSSALQLGFSACGIAKAEPVDEETARAYRQWIADGRQADMHYLEANIDKRLDPTLLLPGARTIIVVAMSYAPARRLPKGEYQIADYALGRDYHDVMKQRLRQLAESAGLHEDVSTQILCVDTVPILERYWAVRAGLGFIGRNHQLIIPGQGSMVFLGEIVTTAETDRYDEPLTLKDHPCSDCRRCLDACPTGALTSHFSLLTSQLQRLSLLSDHRAPRTLGRWHCRQARHDHLRLRPLPACLSTQSSCGTDDHRRAAAQRGPHEHAPRRLAPPQPRGLSTALPRISRQACQV